MHFSPSRLILARKDQISSQKILSVKIFIFTPSLTSLPLSLSCDFYSNMIISIIISYVRQHCDLATHQSSKYFEGNKSSWPSNKYIYVYIHTHICILILSSLSREYSVRMFSNPTSEQTNKRMCFLLISLVTMTSNRIAGSRFRFRLWVCGNVRHPMSFLFYIILFSFSFTLILFHFILLN